MRVSRNPAELLLQAGRCRRLAARTEDFDRRARLIAMADDYEQAANNPARRPWE